jgi:hypothetical protein
MAQDFMHYDQMVQAAYRGIVRDALRRAAKQALPGDHHFFITFRTDFPGVEISDALKARYPQEMTIILQHQYWDLQVHEDDFEVGLSFNKMPEKLLIPFSAIRQFVDPSVKFGLEFAVDAPAGVQSEKGAASLVQRTPTAEAEKPAEKGAVVSLDSFRKK